MLERVEYHDLGALLLPLSIQRLTNSHLQTLKNNNVGLGHGYHFAELVLEGDPLPLFFHDANNAISLLLSIIKSKGVLLINWNDFSAKEQACYQSIVSEPAYIFSKSISPDLRVIGLISQGKTLHRAFESRWRLHSIPFALPRENILQPDELLSTSSQTLIVDLFAVALPSLWQADLLGRVRLGENNEVYYAPGPLILAMRQGVSCHIMNAPDTADFELLCERIMLEKRLYCFGQMEEAAVGFSLKLGKQVSSPF